MKAIVCYGRERFEVASVPDPACEAGYVIVKIQATGLCGTDLELARNQRYAEQPRILGHEFAGEIVEVGRSVDCLKVGQKVAVDPDLYCGQCFYCRKQLTNKCEHWQALGVTLDGGFAEYVAAPAQSCFVLPDGVDYSLGALCEPLSCVIHAIEMMKTSAGERALILGAGAMGLLFIQVLRYAGAGIVAVVEREPKRQDMAHFLGADYCFASIDDTELSILSGKRGFPVVIESSGAGALLEQSFEFLQISGKLMIFGAHDASARLPISPRKIFDNDLTIMGSSSLSHCFDKAINLVPRLPVVEHLISDRVSLDKFPVMYEKFKKLETLKIQFYP
jgi:threonine dehydrogenase-like Zn-dependent dehydrogenase